MKVSVFIDGKSFYSGWRDSVGQAKLDFQAFLDWILESAGCTDTYEELEGAHYYTGVENRNAEAQAKLSGFLNVVEHEDGFDVRRFDRKHKSAVCSECGHDNKFVQDKELNTTLAVDIVMAASSNICDTIVLVSGDADFLPAIVAAQSFGKQVFVTTWGTSSLSNKLSDAVDGYFNLQDGVASFVLEESADTVPESTKQPKVLNTTQDHDPQIVFNNMMANIRDALSKFKNGYLGVNFFVNRWRSDNIPNNKQERIDLLNMLHAAEHIEIYSVEDGKHTAAIRLAKD